jgi:hypothetical protein
VRSCGSAVAACAFVAHALGQCPVFHPRTGGVQFGWDLVNCGDFNDDGYDDFIVSSLWYEPPYLIGGRTGYVFRHYTPTSADYGDGSAVCRTYFELQGQHDIVVVGDRWGRMQFFGDPVGVVRLHDLSYAAEERAIIESGQSESWFGQAVAATVLEDGPHEIVIGAPGYGLTHLDEPERDNRGAVFVYSEGNQNDTPYLIHHIVLGEQRHERFGEAVAVLDPLHNAGYGDPFLKGAFVGAAPRADGDEIDTGRVDVFDMVTGDLAYSLYGESAFDWFGTAVAAAGDVDGDDYNDLIVGAPSHSSVHAHAGRAYVFSGVDGRLLWTWDGEATNDRFGAAVAAAGDVNGDGAADLLVGAPLHSSRLRNAGRVYLYSGADGELLKVLDGRTVDEQFGKSLAGAWQYEASERYFVGAPMFEDDDSDIDGVTYVLSDQPLLDGDINQDGWVDQTDLGVLLTTYDLPPDDPAFNPLADVNGDGLVNQSDLGLLLVNYGQQCSAE